MTQTLPTQQRQIIYARRPQGVPTVDCFQLVQVPVTRPGPGKVLVRNDVLSVDPYIRMRMEEKDSYAPVMALGDVLVGRTVGQVLESSADGFAEGDWVVGRLGWQDYSVAGPGVKPLAASTRAAAWALRALPAWAWGCSSQACSRAWASVCAAAGAVASTKVSNHPVNRPGLLYRKGCESMVRMVLRAPRRADFRKITNLSSTCVAAVRQAQSGAEPCRSTAPMKILIVEDEPKTGDYLQQGLAESGFVVDLARNGVDGLHLAVTGDHDLLVLDVMLPGLNGWQVLETLRRSGKEIPVLFLTARDQVEDRVRGLELGADDYLVKPFAFSEFLARVRTLLRRGRSGMESTALRAADLELDLLRRRVVRGGQRIDLTAKEFALLELLMRRQGEVLPRSLIASQVWDMNFDSDTNVIEVAMRRLRAKVDDAFEPKLIRTVRGMGYVLEAP